MLKREVALGGVGAEDDRAPLIGDVSRPQASAARGSARLQDLPWGGQILPQKKGSAPYGRHSWFLLLGGSI